MAKNNSHGEQCHYDWDAQDPLNMRLVCMDNPEHWIMLLPNWRRGHLQSMRKHGVLIGKALREANKNANTQCENACGADVSHALHAVGVEARIPKL